MYLECIRCPKLGKSCDGPNFVALPPDQLIAWAKERKKHLGLTNAKLAEMANMAQGTVDSLLANTHADFKFGTIRPLLQVLVGGEWQGDPCPDPENKLDAELRETVRHLEAEVKWRDEKIQYLETEHTRTLEDLSGRVSRHQANQEFLRTEIKKKNEEIAGKNKTVAILAALLGIAWVIIIAALIADKIDPTRGFFWLGSLFKHTSGLFLLTA